MRRLGLLATFAALLWQSTASAQQTSTMIGDITDASTGQAIEGAVVVVKSPSLQGEQVATTEATGRYTITWAPAGVVADKASQSAYATVELTVR